MQWYIRLHVNMHAQITLLTVGRVATVENSVHDRLP